VAKPKLRRFVALSLPKGSEGELAAQHGVLHHWQCWPQGLRDKAHPQVKIMWQFDRLLWKIALYR